MYDFPFLDKGIIDVYSDPPERNKSFGPLFMSQVHVKYPTLLFIGLQEKISILQYFLEWQAIFIQRVVLGLVPALENLPKAYAE